MAKNDARARPAVQDKRHGQAIAAASLPALAAST
jgi:hypothetical protein